MRTVLGMALLAVLCFGAGVFVFRASPGDVTQHPKPRVRLQGDTQPAMEQFGAGVSGG